MLAIGCAMRKKHIVVPVLRILAAAICVLLLWLLLDGNPGFARIISGLAVAAAVAAWMPVADSRGP